MARLSALIYTASLLFVVSCAGGSGAPPDPVPTPNVDVGVVVDAATLDTKVLFEYRGHFGCPDDEAGLGDWLGWFEGGSSWIESAAVAYLPDVSDLSASELCSTDMRLPDGSRAHAFSSANSSTVVRHFGWMESYGLDGVFLRRSVEEPEDGRLFGFRNRVAQNVMAGAEAHGRVFAIIYDLGGATPGSVERDWAYVVGELELTSSERYLHHDGRPVLGLDGSGLAHENTGLEDLLNLISSLRAVAPGDEGPALFVVVPARWQSHEGGSWAELQGAVDYISPWGVGEYGDEAEAAHFGVDVLAPGAAEAEAAGAGYAPVVWPGLSGRAMPLNAIPRDGGRFYWRQVYEAVSAGADALYVASFDGMDDGTAMFKLAPGY